MNLSKKIATVASVAVMGLVGMTGCSTNSSKTYYCTQSGHTSSYIKLNKGDKPTKGTGYAKNVCWNDGWWDLTGNFKYTSSKVTMTSGIYRNQTFDDNISCNYNASKIKFNGYTYKNKK